MQIDFKLSTQKKELETKSFFWMLIQLHVPTEGRLNVNETIKTKFFNTEVRKQMSYI